jgi:UDP-glucose 4-epimerase
MKILVTGAAGFIGSFCVRKLKRQGHEVVAIDNFSESHPDGVTSHCDVRDIHALYRLMKGCDAVMHFAAMASVPESIKDPQIYWSSNTLGTHTLIDVMVEADVNKLVFSSTAAVYAPCDGLLTESTPVGPITPYGTSKLASEFEIQDYSRAYELTSTIFRYLCVVGADQNGRMGENRLHETHLIASTLRAAKNGGEMKVCGIDFNTPDGTGIRDYVHVEDIVDAHILALNQEKCDTFVLGTGVGHSVLEVLDCCDKVTGIKTHRVITDRRPGDPARLVAVPDKAQRVLGWKAKKDLQSIVESSWKWENNK